LISDRSQPKRSIARAEKANVDREIFSWSIHQVPGSPSAALQRQLIGVSSVVIVCIVYAAILKDALVNEPPFFITFILVAIALLAFYLKIARQKTAYHYQVYEDHAALEHHVYYSDLEIGIIKTLAAICMFVFVGAALITGSILFLIGPAAIGFLAALRLLNWQNPVTHENSLPFNEYNFVTVDRKRRVIVTHVQDLTLGFEARLPDDKLFEQYLNLLKSALPPTAEFTEKKWESDLL
jgi:hypothetical protein